MADTLFFSPFLRSRKLSVFANVAFLFLLSFSLASRYLLPENHSTEPEQRVVHSTEPEPRVVHSTEPEPRVARSTETYWILLNKEIGEKVTCTGVHHSEGHEFKCRYVRSHPSCDPQGFINYLRIFYCSCGRFPPVGHVILLLWLAVLFYLLGDTAASYFCSSLEGLSRVLRLSPTIAGVTLLSLGNGAPDVFASVASFKRSESGGVGINSVLGGAFFISSFVAGIICVLVGRNAVSIDHGSFVRDTLFLLLSLGSLLFIVFLGKITPWLALCYVSIYFLYVGFLSFSNYWRNKNRKESNPAAASSSSNHLSGELSAPFLSHDDEEKQISVQERTKECCPQEQTRILNFFRSNCHLLTTFLRLLELPLYLPRRLTIPVVSEERWSKPFAVASVTFAPIFLAKLCNFRSLGPKKALALSVVSALIGTILGSVVFIRTKRAYPPKKCLLPWLIGGFVMSVTWTYIIAQELVSLLVSLGTVLAINPSVLGLTVLAWGNSLGDLITNVTMAVSGGPGGAQMALAGCYAGPMFNTLVGLGVPFVLASLAEYPHAYVVPTGDHTALYETIGFLMGGLLWALVVLPRRNMKPDKVLGGGLLTMYFCFLFLKLVRAFGIVNFQ